MVSQDSVGTHPTSAFSFNEPLSLDPALRDTVALSPNLRVTPR